MIAQEVMHNKAEKKCKCSPYKGMPFGQLLYCIKKIQLVLPTRTFIWPLWGFPRPARICTTKDCDGSPGVRKHQPGPSSTCEVPLPYVLLSFRHPCKCYTTSSVGPGGILQPYTTQRSLIHPQHTTTSLLYLTWVLWDALRRQSIQYSALIWRAHLVFMPTVL